MIKAAEDGSVQLGQLICAGQGQLQCIFVALIELTPQWRLFMEFSTSSFLHKLLTL